MSLINQRSNPKQLSSFYRAQDFLLRHNLSKIIWSDQQFFLQRIIISKYFLRVLLILFNQFLSVVCVNDNFFIYKWTKLEKFFEVLIIVNFDYLITLQDAQDFPRVSDPKLTFSLVFFGVH